MKLTGRSSFPVDESFVFQHLSNEIDDDNKELLDMFIEQSREAQAKVATTEDNEAVEPGSATVSNAFYRICGLPPKQCDDSPLQDIEHPERITGRKGTVFGHKGKFVVTDGTGSRTKLTKVYKRDDNRGALLNALKRMRLNF